MPKVIKQKNNKKQWKPLQLEGSFTSGDFDGLIGIEELVDYNVKSISTSKKRNNSASEESSVKTKENREPGMYVRNPKQLIAANSLQPSTKLKPPKKKIKQSTDKTVESNAPGTFVRRPKHLQLSNAKPQKLAKKLKVEIGENVPGEKCSVNDLSGWNFLPLPESLLKGLADLNFIMPTPIQELTLPASMHGRRDILGAAETGSGKTLAFGLPILSGILKLKEEAETSVNEDFNKSDESDFEEMEEEHDLEDNGIGCVKSINNIKLNNDKLQKKLKLLYALILTPTRELAIQIKNHLKAVSKYSDIKIAVVVGGLAAVKQERLLNRGPEIVVATPGRLWELIQEGNQHLSQIDNIRYLVIDETDRMMERNHFEELHSLLERLNIDETKRKMRQNFVFSATLTLVHDLPQHLFVKKKINLGKRGSKIMKLTPAQKLQQMIEMLGITDPKCIDITHKKGTANSLMECRINCEINEKDYYVYYFLQRHQGRTLIFCNSIGCVKRLATLLSLLRHLSLPLHASMPQRQRLKNLERFRDDPNAVLVATEVAARGLDIPNIEHVLHYQMPRTVESYIHRSGRTARASNEGLTVLFIEPQETKNYLKMCRTLERFKDLPMFPVQSNILKDIKQRVNLARELDSAELRLKKVSAGSGWLQKAASEMDIIVDDDDLLSRVADREDISALKRRGNIIRKQLVSLLDKPILPPGFTKRYSTDSFDFQSPFDPYDEKVKERAVDVVKEFDEFVKSGKKKTNVTI